MICGMSKVGGVVLNAPQTRPHEDKRPYPNVRINRNDERTETKGVNNGH